MNSERDDLPHQAQIERGERFRFGENWMRFLGTLSDARIAEAEQSLRHMLGVTNLAGKSFLDIGSGSGLFSLAARRLGATVHSFDFDPQSVACTRELRTRFFDGDPYWNIGTGSVLDAGFLESLGVFDVVYSWGVLHHTGSMWRAIDNATRRVAPDGLLYIAIYNRQTFATGYWTAIKRAYNRWPITKPLLIGAHAIYPTLPSVVLRLLRGGKYPRGMSVWFDLKDWLGGYPFEVATPEEIFDYCCVRGFELVKLKTVGSRMGCNEFTFARKPGALPAQISQPISW